jgi:uncharacterized membrane protein YfcA
MLHDVLAICSGSLVDFVLGLIGGGGSILAAPLLVYVVAFDRRMSPLGQARLRWR